MTEATKLVTEPRGHVWEAEDGGLTCVRCGLGYTNLPCINESQELPHASKWPEIRRQCMRLRGTSVCEYPWWCSCTVPELELAPDTRTEGIQA